MSYETTARRLLHAFRGTPDGYRKVAVDYYGSDGWYVTSLDDDGHDRDDDEWHVVEWRVVVDGDEIRFVPGPREEPIHIEFVYPPIPIRQFDWAAYRDPERHTGRGATQAEAIADLLMDEAAEHDYPEDTI